MNILNKVRHFEKCVFKYIEYFGLFGWEVDISSEDIPDTEACCFYNIESKSSNICYSAEWLKTKDADVKTIDKAAFHEVAELFLCEIRENLKNKNLLMDELKADSLVHSVIRFMENKIWRNL